MSLSIVIPAYNESENITKVIDDIYRHFDDVEIIVVNDCSTDSTFAKLNKASKFIDIKILTNKKNRGHGYSVIRGLKAATGDYILYIDADRQISLSNFKIHEGVDFLNGYRVDRQDKLFRKVISFCLKTTNLIRHGFYIRDANCPFKIYRREALIKVINKVPKSYIIPIACLEVLARQAGLRTREIPVLHHKYHTVRKGTLQSINKKSIKFFRDAFGEIVSI